jgi:xylulokinase
MDLLLAIDAGTTSVKAGLFAPDGRMLALRREEYQLDTPSVERAQLDPQKYWQACVRTVRQVVEEAGVRPEQIRALGVSSQGETTITLDREGQAIYPAMVWLDNRAVDQAAALAKKFSDQVYDVCGVQELIPTWTACKLLWLRENEPQVFARAWKFMLVQDFLIYRMTGRAVTDGSVACTSALYDIRNHVWWPEMLAAVGVEAERLPEIIQPGSQVGRLTAQAAEALGLSPETLVVDGGMDQSTGAIGAGNISPGIISESTGAALGIHATIPSPALDPQKMIPVCYHSLPGKYLFAPVCPTAGMALKWLRDTFFQPEILAAEATAVDAYDALTALAAETAPGADGLLMLPHLMGAYSPVANAAARGVFSGFTLSHGRGHFVRAVLEGVAFMLRQNLDTIREAGVPVRELRSTGGGSRSPLWNQIKSDVCQLPLVTLASEDTALLGDAMLAGVACGVFASVEEASRAMVIVKEKYLPAGQSGLYEEAYRRYCDLDSSLGGYFKRNYSAAAG